MRGSANQNIAGWCSDAVGQARCRRQSSITGGTRMLAVCLPMCSTVDSMARGDKGDITINSQGQGFTSYSPHPTVFKGLCPTTVGHTAPTAPLSADTLRQTTQKPM